jgi:hypothetical protein
MTKARDLSQIPNATLAFRNRIINGAMMIDQRNAGASVANTVDTIYTLDRWTIYGAQASKFTCQQNAGSVTPPIGFTNYLGITSSSAYTVGSNETFLLRQYIEGFNIADLGWGTANAKTVTLSFQVYSSLTGTFGGSLMNFGFNRSYPFTYSVPVANTWTTISVTIAGDTSGTWVTNNGLGIRVAFSLGTGSTLSGTAGSWSGSTFFSATGATSVVGTNGATFYITGVQLEKGSTATSFDYRPYGTELSLCQRYTRTYGDGLSGVAVNISTIYLNGSFEQPMRAAPTATITDTSIQVSNQFNADYTSTNSVIAASNTSSVGFRVSFNGFSGLTQGQFISPFGNTNGSVFLLSAEL